VGLYLAQFDSGGTDYIFGLGKGGGAGKFAKKSPATGSSFATTGLTAEFLTSATALSGAHYNNRHYLCNGEDLNVVALSDGTVRRMGMNPPQAAPTAVASTVAQAFQRTASADAAINYGAGVEGWLNTAALIEGTKVTDSGTFAYVTIGKADVYESAKEQTWTFGSYTAVDSRLEVSFRLTTGNVTNNPGDTVGSGGGHAGRFQTRIIVKFSINNGSSYTTIVNTVLDRSMQDVVTIQVPVANATYTGGTAIKVIASAQLLKKGDGHSFRVEEIRMAKGGAASNITTTTGFYYQVTEWDQEATQESGPSPVSAIVTMAANNLVTVTLPTAVQNTRSTHWKIYRTPDGGEAPLQSGFVAQIGIAQATWADSFVRPYNLQAPFTVEIIGVSGAGGTVYNPLHGVPPTCKQFWVHRGRLKGLPADSDRAVAYSEPGYPESWPVVNADNDYPLQEGDRLIAGVSLGDIEVMFCSTTVVVQNDSPSWTDGQFRATVKATLRGAPGAVSQDAIASFTAGGQSRVAWVSYQGIYVTDGHTAERISDDQDWSTFGSATSVLSTARLHWDKHRQCLVFAYDSDGGGNNDRFALIHMAPEHQKANGMPLWTGPHYGTIAAMASGMVSGVHKLWSMSHVAIVYEENNGTTDAASTYSSTQVPLIVKTGRLYGDALAQALGWRDWGAYKARLRHSAAGGSETVSVQWQTGRDSSGVTQTVTQTPSIVSQQANEFYVGIGGEWTEIQLTHTGSANWAILDLTADVQPMGRSGRVA
jgi:hypothetical protein